MLQLFDVNHNKICGLVNYKDLVLEREINQLDTLSFLYPISDDKHNLIQEECYIRTKDNEYVIKEVNYNDDNYDKYVCKVNIEGISGKDVSHFEAVEQTCTDSVNLALSGTGWTVGSCDVTKKRTAKKNNCTVFDVLQEIQDAFICEMTFDAVNKKVYIYEEMGADKGAYFIDQLNLKAVNQQRNSYDYITRLIPMGKDNLDITSVNNGKNYVENYQYSSKVITAYWEDNRYTVAQDLLDDATERLNYLSKPLKGYSATVYDLAKVSDKYSILDYNLGDTITLINKDRNIKEKQRIVKTTEYLEEPEKNTIEIANKLASVDNLIVRFQGTSDTVDTVTTTDGSLDGSKIDGVDWTKVNNVSIRTADIQDASITTTKIGQAQITEALIADASISNAKIQNAAIDTANIKDAAITNAKIANASIDTAQIQDAAITNAKIGNASIGTANIQDAAINTAKIANGAITTALIGTGAIETEQVADSSITDAKIVTLTANKLTAGTIDASKINVTNLNCANLTVGTINGQQIATGTISLNNLASDATSAISTAQTTANGKNTIYYGSTTPTGSFKTGDLWMKSVTGGISPYQWNGSSWINITDIAVSNALTTANSNAQGYANTAQSNAISSADSYTDGKISAVNSNISAVQTTANSKNTVYYQTAQPSGGIYKVNDIWYDTDDGYKMYYYNGSTWTATQFGTDAIANLSITNALIADGTILNAKIGTLDAGKITTGTLSAARIGAGTITGTMIAGTTITASNIAAGTITSASGVIGALDAGAITTGTLAAARIGAGTITGNMIAGTTISASNIISGTITATQIASGTITGTLIAGTTITADKIVTGTITSAQIAANTITANKIAANTITAAQIASGTITADRLAAGTITASSACISSLKADWITSGTITGITISGNTINGNTITGGTISGTTITGGTISGTTLNGVTVNSSNINAVNTVNIGGSSSYFPKLQFSNAAVGAHGNSSIQVTTTNPGTASESDNMDIYLNSAGSGYSGSLSISSGDDPSCSTKIYVENGTFYIDRYAGRLNTDQLFYGTGNCRMDTTSGMMRLYVSDPTAADTGVRIRPSGEVDFMYGSTANAYILGSGAIHGTSKSAITNTIDYGQVITYSDESPDHVFNDRGRGKLDSTGSCTITIDPIFAETVNTKDGNYHVQLTGIKTNNIYVDDLQADYFVVKGEPDKEFFWMITAERYGYEGLRFNDADLDV